MIGFSSTALLMTPSVHLSQTLRAIDEEDGLTVEAGTLGVLSLAPLAAGTTLSFTDTASFIDTGPPMATGTTQTTVTGAVGMLTLAFASAALAAGVQPALTTISTEIAAGSVVAESVSGGALPGVPAGMSGLAEIDAGGNITLAATYQAVVDLASTPVILIASSAASQLIIDAGSGDFTYAAVGATDTVYAGAGNSLVFGGGAYLDVFGGSGAATIIGGGGGNTVAGGDGAQLVFGSSALTYSGGPGAATIIGGGNGNTITGGSGNLLLFAFSSMNYIGTGGAATVIGGNGKLNANLGYGGGVTYGSPGGGDTLATYTPRKAFSSAVARATC